MAWAYFDTSALVKRYVSEAGSLRVEVSLRRHDFLSSSITPVEVVSALCRRRRAGDFSEENFRRLLRRVKNDRAQWELVEVSSLVLERAEELIQGTAPIKTLDAIHVASWMIFQAASSIQIPFVTGDTRQRDAASRLGLDVVWIG
jgi:predicted nucleic acid-binding protein